MPQPEQQQRQAECPHQHADRADDTGQHKAAKGPPDDLRADRPEHDDGDDDDKGHPRPSPRLDQIAGPVRPGMAQRIDGKRDARGIEQPVQRMKRRMRPPLAADHGRAQAKIAHRQGQFDKPRPEIVIEPGAGEQPEERQAGRSADL